MADARGNWWRMLAHATIGLALVAPQPALAATPAAADLATWVARNTDLDSAQVALVDEEKVYSVEPLGGLMPTGEIIVLVRTEPLADNWAILNGFSSWDGNLLVDCRQRGLRIIRSATYPRRNRVGAPKPERQNHEAQKPLADAPAAQLIAAACDPAFAWPLRGIAQAQPQAVLEPEPAAPSTLTIVALEKPPAPAASPPLTVTGPEPVAPTAPAASPLPASTTRPSGWLLQVAHGRSEEGAQRAANAARKTLTSGARTVTGWVETTPAADEGEEHRALVGAFRSHSEALAACETLKRARQDCVVRKGSSEPETPPVVEERKVVAAAAPVTPGPTPEPTPAAAAEPTPAGPMIFAIQVARGSQEDGARWALARARKTLGPLAESLRDAVAVSYVPVDRIRYEARLEGFPTSEAATAACRKLSSAGQDCFALQAPAADPAPAQPAE
jgi:hypothetical protein